MSCYCYHLQDQPYLGTSVNVTREIRDPWLIPSLLLSGAQGQKRKAVNYVPHNSSFLIEQLIESYLTAILTSHCNNTQMGTSGTE